MANKKLLTLDAEFPRSWEDVLPDGEVMSCVTQPYITGLYLAISNGTRTVAQLTIPYRKLSKFIKDLQKSDSVKNLHLTRLGDFLDESDLEYINN